jgi:hypothetical protein
MILIVPLSLIWLKLKSIDTESNIVESEEEDRSLTSLDFSEQDQMNKRIKTKLKTMLLDRVKLIMA